MIASTNSANNFNTKLLVNKEKKKALAALSKSQNRSSTTQRVLFSSCPLWGRMSRWSNHVLQHPEKKLFH
jgi:hypothetical protein